MNAKSVLRVALLLVVFGSLGVYAMKKSSSRASEASAGEQAQVDHAETDAAILAERSKP